jgi:DNA-binding response OmpR family regulator
MSNADAPARVLIVEDDDRLSAIVARHLRARGHDARVAASAEDALDLLQAGFRPTVVLLDINLPGDSGWGLLRSGALRAAGAPAVYVVSAVAPASTHLREFLVTGYLPKPFPLATLVDIVERSAAHGGGATTATVGERGPDAG